MIQRLMYQPLKAGDVRQRGDEVAQRTLETGCYYMTPKAPSGIRAFTPVNLIGHPILVADLVHLEFRRPV